MEHLVSSYIIIMFQWVRKKIGILGNEDILRNPLISVATIAAAEINYSLCTIAIEILHISNSLLLMLQPVCFSAVRTRSYDYTLLPFIIDTFQIILAPE